MSESSRNVVVLAGPNGAGKTTAAPALLRDSLKLSEFVNADTIAQGLSGFDPERHAFAAGRIMLSRIRALAERGASFAFETTLATRSFAPLIERLVGSGYRSHLLFLWLPSADLAVERVRSRVSDGGHNVPEETVRRRYQRGLQNFTNLYRPLASNWIVYDNSDRKPSPIAEGHGSRDQVIHDPTRWAEFERAAHGG